MMTVKTKKRRVKTSKGLKEYTYLGCPLTRNRSPWCFRMCDPDLEGRGHCGRFAPHAFTGRIQAGIQEYNKRQRAAHCRKLESMYLNAPCNEYYESGIRISEGEAEVVVPVQDKLLDAAGSVHASVIHGAMNDAALFAANSIVPKQLMRSTGFNILFTGSIAEGDLIARGRVIGIPEGHWMIEAVVLDGTGKELGRGTGTFVKTDTPLSSDMGYK
jgi:acyl-coenzyme A thioesterase PaaI-like protein